MKKTTTGTTFAFRLSYIILPVAILLLSVLLCAFFYPRLPAEVAYHFKDGSPDKWLSRSNIVLWMLVPQLFLTLLAGAITWGIARLAGLYIPPERTGIRLERIIVLMGNMITLPQIILGFAILDIFSYNSYQIHLLPLWVFALLVMVVGGIILGILFSQAVRQGQRVSKE